MGRAPVYHLNDIALVIKMFSNKFTSILIKLKIAFTFYDHISHTDWTWLLLFEPSLLSGRKIGLIRTHMVVVHLSTCLLVLVSGHRVPYLRQAIFPTCFLVHSMHSQRKRIALKKKKLNSLCHKSDFNPSWMDDIIWYKYVTLFMASDMLVIGWIKVGYKLFLGHCVISCRHVVTSSTINSL